MLVTFTKTPTPSVRFGRNVNDKRIPEGMPVDVDWAIGFLACSL